LVEGYGKLPLSFEINKGQTDSTVKFLSRGSGYSLFLTGNEAVLALRKGNSNGKKQMAKGKSEFQYSPFDAPSSLLQRPASFQFPVSNFQTPATNDEPPTTGALLRMKLVRANSNPKIVGTDELPGKSNYFIGNDPKKWRTNVSTYAKVKYGNVYPGVDLVYYGNQGKLEYDFVVQPGADPRQIALDVGAGRLRGQGAHATAGETPALRIDGNGDLVVATDGGEVIFHKPVIYQPATYDEARTTNGGGRDSVEGKYVLRSDNRISFELAHYDRRRPIVIDPVLAYSTYLGGSRDDAGFSMAVDSSGNAYITGFAWSSDFPTTPGAFQTRIGSEYNAFISKLNSAGSALVYSTYLGSWSWGNGIAVDASGNAYVTGWTCGGFPTTPGAFQTTYLGSDCFDSAPGSVFVTKLNATGSALLYSTFVGGNNGSGQGMAIDASGNAYVTGRTGWDFPTTPGAFQSPTNPGYFVTKLNGAGSALVYSTSSIGGAAIAVDASGNAYVTGVTGSADVPTTPDAFQPSYGGGYQDAFVTKLNAAGSALVYSTYLGGTNTENGSSIAVDASGNAYVTGATSSSDFPTTSGAFQTTYGGNGDAFVSKINPAGSALVYSTYLGGANGDGGNGIAVDVLGNAYLTGCASSSNFPTTPDAFQTMSHGGTGPPGYGCGDAFVTKLNASGSALVYSTYLGGDGYDSGSGIAVDLLGNVYVTGQTLSTSDSIYFPFPVTPGAFQTTYGGGHYWGDAFVVKMSLPNVPVFAANPSSLTFGPQALGTTSAAQTVRLINAGTMPLDITSIAPGGDFGETNDCPGTVQPSAFCTLNVTFTPTAAGVRSGVVTVTDNAAGSPQQVSLTGTGGVPAVSLRPSSLTFASQAEGTTSPARQATLTNTGSGPLVITSIATTGDFAQTNNCGSTVNPGASCTLSVTFTPTATGTRSGSIAITDDAAGSPHQLLLTGTGFLGQPAVSLVPADVPFLVLRTVGTPSLPQTVKLTNVGSGQLNITGVTIAGADSGDFAQSNNCPAAVAIHAHCRITVTFKPTVQGLRTASISITDNAPGSPQAVPLTGRGTFLKWSPREMNLGTQPVGTSSAAQIVTLTNKGGVPITLYPIEISGVNPGDFTQTNTCGSSLNPGASCTIQVTFTPTAVGGRLGHVAIRDSAFGGTHWVGLLGKGT
jgi:hypothetical protein